jgi:hypothetical protein
MEGLCLDHERRHASLGARLVFFPRLPDDRVSRLERHALTVAAARPSRAFDDDEELRDTGRVPAEDASRADLDHDRVRAGGEPSHSCVDASRRGRFLLAVEVDPLQSRSITPAIAWPKPMHIVATP